MKDINLHNDIILLGVWIGMWGIVENLINIYIPTDDYKKRIHIHIVIFMISILLLYLCSNATINLL